MLGKKDKKSARIGMLLLGAVLLTLLTMTMVTGISAQSGTNVVVNGSFENATQGWRCTYCTIAAGAPAQAGAAAGQLQTTSATKRAQLYQTSITLQPNTQYEISFWARSGGPDLQVDLIKHTSPFTNYGLNQTFNVTTSWQKFTLVFTTTGFNSPVSNARLRFRSPAGNGQQFSIDDVTLTVRGGSTTPTSTPVTPPPGNTPTPQPTNTPTPPAGGSGSELLAYDWNQLLTTATHGFARVDPPMPSANGNWVTPVNYAEGTFYMRAEVRNMPSHKDMQLQFCVWQSNFQFEACATRQAISYRGSTVVATWSQPVANMWKKNGVPIDWTKPRQRYAAAVKNAQGKPVSNSNGWNWNGEDPKEWYPMDLRFTVVVVEKGKTFSGWQNYIR